LKGRDRRANNYIQIGGDMKSRSQRSSENVACKGEMRIANTILIQSAEGKRPLTFGPITGDEFLG
jgi:hypothetical protein